MKIHGLYIGQKLVTAEKVEHAKLGEYFNNGVKKRANSNIAYKKGVYAPSDFYDTNPLSQRKITRLVLDQDKYKLTRSQMKKAYGKPLTTYPIILSQGGRSGYADVYPFATFMYSNESLYKNKLLTVTLTNFNKKDALKYKKLVYAGYYFPAPYSSEQWKKGSYLKYKY